MYIELSLCYVNTSNAAGPWPGTGSRPDDSAVFMQSVQAQLLHEEDLHAVVIVCDSAFIYVFTFFG